MHSLYGWPRLQTEPPARIDEVSQIARMLPYHLVSGPENHDRR
jgi:hypothetical protein